MLFRASYKLTLKIVGILNMTAFWNIVPCSLFKVD
jgi:hypothetical protein